MQRSGSRSPPSCSWARRCWRGRAGGVPPPRPTKAHEVARRFWFLGLTLLMTGSSGGAARVSADSAKDLAKLCDAYWQGYLKTHPTYATSIGDPRHDDRLARQQTHDS